MLDFRSSFLAYVGAFLSAYSLVPPEFYTNTFCETTGDDVR